MIDKEIFEESVSEDISAQEFKCQACGANLEFNPESQKFFCPHCKTERSFVVTKQVDERDFEEILKNEKWKSAEVKIVRCQNCGATEVFQNKEIAKSCSFCGSAKVLRTDDFQGLKPNVVIPFKLTAEAAAKICLNWLRKKLFAPSKFKKEVTVDNIHGVYYPVWTFDSSVFAYYHGRLGKYHTVTYRDGKGGTRTRRELRWFSVRGSMSRMFDDIMINAGGSISENRFNGLKPFAQCDYVKYENSFLAGFSANTYSVEPLDAWRRAEKIIENTLRDAIVRRYNADVVGSLSLDLRYEGKSFKYILVPVYISAAYFKEKLYNQYVNGAHGKICGSAPVSPVKVSVTALLGVGIVALAAFLYWYFTGR